MKLALLRTLFPSWRFFDHPGSPYLLEVRWNPEREDSHWEPFEPVLREQMLQDRTLAGLLFSPSTNLAMAWQSAVEILAQEQAQSQDTPEPIAGEAIEQRKSPKHHSVSSAVIRDGIESRSRGRPFRYRLVCDGEVLLEGSDL